MPSDTKFGRLRLRLQETQRLLKCSLCSKPVRGPTKALSCNHLACSTCQGECCGKKVTRKTLKQPCRNDVQEFAKRLSDLLSAYNEESKEQKQDLQSASSKKKPKAEASNGLVNNTRTKQLSRSNTREKRNAVEKPLKLENLAVAAIADPVEDIDSVPESAMQSESPVESPMDLSTLLRPRSSPSRRRFPVFTSSSSWVPLDLSGKSASVQQWGLGLHARMYRRSFAPMEVYPSDFNGVGLPQSRAVVTSPFIPQMNNPRKENGFAKRKVVEILEQQERKKTKLQKDIPESSHVTKQEILMEVEDVVEPAEEPRQEEEPEVTNATPVETASAKNGTVVRTDDDWDNDEEISLVSPSKLQATPRTNVETATATVNSEGSDPFADDFCFQAILTPDSKDGKTGSVIVSPQQVKQTTPSRACAVNKKLEQVRTRLSLGDSGTTAEDKEVEKNAANHEDSICNEDFPEFFSCSSDVPPTSEKPSNTEEVNKCKKTETPGKKGNPRSNTSTPASKTPSKKALDSPRLATSPTSNRPQRKSLVLCPTRLTRYQTARLEKFAATFGAKITRNYTDDVTHVIFTFENGAIPQTMKYLMAIAGKKWVLECRWVEECIKENRIVTEELYEATSKDDPGAKLSRLSKLPLFPGLRFYIQGSFTYSGASAKEWMTLIRTLGGRIEEDVSQLASDVLIIGDSNDDITTYDELYEKYQAVTLAWEWVLACTIKYNLEPVTPNYCISPKTDSDEELAAFLPGFLLDCEAENSA